MRLVALLRGINVGGNRKVPMAELRAIAAELGLADVATYLQSGNLVCTSSKRPAHLGAALERAIEARFGFAVDVVVRDAEAWGRMAAATPFPDAERDRPHLLHVGVAKTAIPEHAVATLRARAGAGERIELRDGALVLDYAAGVARSKLTPAAIDRAAGSPVTCRNWRTVLELDRLLRE